MRYYTATEAAQVLGVNEKTVRRWITNGKLEATRRASNELAIPESEIERLHQERAPFHDSQANDSEQDTASRLAALERGYHDLLERVERLEAQGLALPMTRTRTPREPRVVAIASSELFSTDQLLPGTLPAGSLLYSDFAALHSVNTYTFRDHLLKGIGGDQPLEHIAIPTGRRNEHRRYLTPAQQLAAIRYWERHGTMYTSCDACPHQQTATRQESEQADFPTSEL